MGMVRGVYWGQQMVGRSLSKKNVSGEKCFHSTVHKTKICKIFGIEAFFRDTINDKLCELHSFLYGRL